MLKSPTCEAQFRRLLQVGMVNKVYDNIMFPTPEELKEQFMIVDNGKKIFIPHPVQKLRVWRAKTQAYEDIDPLLEGAPDDSSAEASWNALLDEFRASRGVDYINGLFGTN